MICKIADLIVDVPAVGDLVPRCRDYRFNPEESAVGADITICTDSFRRDAWPTLSENDAIYLESGLCFRSGLLAFEGLILHSSAVVVDGKAYLFSAPSGTGKSTHVRLWQKRFGDGAVVINDDKPALRILDGVWYAYGTPWCGKDGINCNRKAPVAGICFLKQGGENRIRRLETLEAIHHILWQSAYKFKSVESMDRMLALVDRLVRQIPVYELENLPNEQAARLSYETMHKGAQEMGL